jgi:pilus assembly protein Flp/PilA
VRYFYCVGFIVSAELTKNQLRNCQHYQFEAVTEIALQSFNLHYQEKYKMNQIMNKIRDFINEEEGLTTVEYAVAGTLIALAVIAAFTQLGEQVGNNINAIDSKITP